MIAGRPGSTIKCSPGVRWEQMCHSGLFPAVVSGSEDGLRVIHSA